MPDYKKVCHQLIADLSDIIDRAISVIEQAEENIISDDANQPTIFILDKQAENKNSEHKQSEMLSSSLVEDSCEE